MKCFIKSKQVSGICDEIIKLGYGEKLNLGTLNCTLEDDEMLRKMLKQN